MAIRQVTKEYLQNLNVDENLLSTLTLTLQLFQLLMKIILFIAIWKFFFSVTGRKRFITAEAVKYHQAE